MLQGISTGTPCVLHIKPFSFCPSIQHTPCLCHLFAVCCLLYSVTHVDKIACRDARPAFRMLPFHVTQEVYCHVHCSRSTAVAGITHDSSCNVHLGLEWIMVVLIRRTTLFRLAACLGAGLCDCLHLQRYSVWCGSLLFCLVIQRYRVRHN